MLGYALCTSPRSGSNFFCQLLESTGLLGKPREYFDGYARRALDFADYPDDVALQVEWIRTRATTANGVYGVKLFPWHFAKAASKVDLLAELPGLKFIRLRRIDTLGQAISWTRALQTNQYRSTQLPQGDVKYDPESITKQLHRLVTIDAIWDAYFARTAQPSLQLSYEGILQGPESSVASVFAYMNVRGERADERKVTVKEQRDALTEEWRARYLADRGDPNIIHTAAEDQH